MGILRKLQQNSTGRGRVNECDQFIVGTRLRFLVDQSNTERTVMFENCMNVCNVDTEVVNTLPSLAEETTDGSIGVCRLQEFEMAFANIEECCPHLLLGYIFNMTNGLTEETFIEW